MNDVSLNKDETARAATVTVTLLSGDTVRLDYTGGMTYSQYLAEAGVKVEKGQVVTSNGHPVHNLDSTPEPDSVIVVAGAVRNG